MSDFKFYTGVELLALKLKPRPWLVEGILHVKDTVLLVGSEKAGKTLLAYQLVCSMTSGHPFLDEHNVVRPCRVSYLQLEGEIEDTVDRLARMSQAVDLDPDLLQLAYLPPINLEDDNIALSIIEQVRPHNPDLLIIDPVYFALEGDLSDNTAVRRFIGNMRKMKNSLDCAIMMVHHTHKLRTNSRGDVLQEGDEATFGSKFFKAYPDHTLLFTYDKKKEVRVLTCGTQRSGSIKESQTLELVQPDPLYFKTVSQIPTKQAVLLKAFPGPDETVTYEELESRSGFSRQTIYATLRELRSNGLVDRDASQRPVLYRRLSV